MAVYSVNYSSTEKTEILSFLGKTFTQTWQHQRMGWAIKETHTISEQAASYFNLPLELLEAIRSISNSTIDYEVQEILTELRDYETSFDSRSA